jgi:ubiquinone/menaquinone biosynthesis C-methylase UbiE
MEFKDYFSTQSEIYLRSRPTYPDELFKFLTSLAPATDLVWDCATGNGQAAVSLSNYFKKVIATDASEQQIKNVIQHERVNYSVALAENSGIKSNTVDLVTIASALHWMDFNMFYKEVSRVLKPRGVFAAWACVDYYIDDTINPIAMHLSHEILADYWPPEANYIDNHYRDIPFPFKAIETPEFKTSVIGNLEFVIGNMYSWSGTQRYIKANGKDPVELVKKQLESAWGDASKTREIKWDIVLKAGRKE